VLVFAEEKSVEFAHTSWDDVKDPHDKGFWEKPLSGLKRAWQQRFPPEGTPWLGMLERFIGQTGAHVLQSGGVHFKGDRHPYRPKIVVEEGGIEFTVVWVYGGDSSITHGGGHYYAVLALDDGNVPISYIIKPIGQKKKKKGLNLTATGRYVSDRYFELVRQGQRSLMARCTLVEDYHSDRMDSILNLNTAMHLTPTRGGRQKR
jgi:hypothetical protein